MTEQRYEELMVRVVDHTASPAEQEELMTYLAQHPDKRSELEAQQGLKALTDGWVQRLEHDLHIDAHEEGSAYKLESAVGWMLLLGATVSLSVGTVYELWIDPEVPLWLSVGMSFGAGGTVVLLAAAIRWRWSTSASDPYTKVIR